MTTTQPITQPEEEQRNSQKCGKYYGDSAVKSISKYPLTGCVKTVGDLLELVNNPEAVEYWLKSEDINYILYYNPYMIEQHTTETAGLFNYFQTLSHASNFLTKERPRQKLTQYFQKDRAFFSFHVYKLVKKSKKMSEWGLKVLGLDYLDKVKPEMLSPAELHNLSVIKYKRNPSPKPSIQIQKDDQSKKSDGDAGVTLLSLDDIQNYCNGDFDSVTVPDPEPHIESGIIPTEGLTTTTTTTITNTMLENDVIVYDGPKATVYDLSAPFRYAEIITNFLHKWIDNPEEKINRVSEVITGKTNYSVFMQNLKYMYIFFYKLAKETYEANREEIDRAGYQPKPNMWYQLLLEYLDKYQADKDCDDKIVLPSGFKHGDFIDIEAYRGTGLYMIHLDPNIRNKLKTTSGFFSMDSFDILPTLGDYGHILPEPGFSLVKEHGLAYFYGTEISGFQISNLRKIQLKIDRGEGEGDYYDMHFDKPVYLETSLDLELDSEEMDEVIVDGVYLYGYLTDKFI